MRDDDAPDSFVYGRRDDVLAFAAQVADDRGLDRAWVEDQLARARYQPSVAKAIMPGAARHARRTGPPTARASSSRSASPPACNGGRRTQPRWPTRSSATACRPSWWPASSASRRFYGRMTGHYRVLDSLATLAFDFPKGRSDRSAFYRSELRAYLVWCALEGRDADTARGSFAGAIGWPQFMPSSLLKYAVDFDHDGHVDLSAAATT